jgi:hypothetical protein
VYASGGVLQIVIYFVDFFWIKGQPIEAALFVCIDDGIGFGYSAGWRWQRVGGVLC